MPSSAQLEKFLWWSILGLLVLGFFLNLGVQPLYLEEPRRAFITMEMIENGNWIVPTLWGLPYYNKPPFFNWLLITSTTLFGGFSEWALRLPTVLSTLAIGLLIFGFVKKYAAVQAARYAAVFWLCTAGVLFYFSPLAEIDLFFSLLIIGAIFSIYHFYQKQQYWLLFPSVYLLCGFAFLCKGLPALVFAGLSLLSFFLWKKQFKKLFHLAHFAGIGLFVAIVGGYFYAYAQYQDPMPFVHRLISESGDRTAAKNSILSFISHLVIFPLDFLKELIPVVFLLPFLIHRKGLKNIRENDLLSFCALMLLVNLLPYWISPGTRMRYIYMLLPLAIILMVDAWQHNSFPKKNWRHKTLNGLLGLVIFVLPLGALAIAFIPDFQFISYIWPLSIFFALLFGGLIFLFLKYPQQRILLLFLGLALARIVFDLTIFPQRADSSGAQRNRDMAIEIFEKTGDAPITIVGEDKIFSYTSTYYLNRLRSKVIRAEIEPSLTPGQYYIISRSEAPAGSEILMQYPYEGEERALIFIPPQ